MNSTLRPTCVNPGCGKPAMLDRGRYRVHCSHCQSASWGRWPHREGVTPFKQGRCSNESGHLGWPCPVDWDRAREHGLRVVTEIDHRDGCHTNNDPDNLQELCSICHREKSRRSGDHNRFR